MAFTFKGYKNAQKSRQVKKSPALTAQSTAAPTVPAGKGRAYSSKTPTKAGPVTSDKTPPKAPKVTAAKLNSGPNNKFSRSTRINYRKLRASK